MTEGWSCTKNSTRMSKSCNDLSGTSTMCVSQYQCVCLLANVRKEKKHLSFIKHLSQTGDHKGLHILESNKTCHGHAARTVTAGSSRSSRRPVRIQEHKEDKAPRCEGLRPTFHTFYDHACGKAFNICSV